MNRRPQLAPGKFYRVEGADQCELIDTASPGHWHATCSNQLRCKETLTPRHFRLDLAPPVVFSVSRGAALEEAEEIAQAAWARGWEYREQLRDPGLVSYWVNSIARNLYRARFRSAVPVPLEHVQEPSYAFDTSSIDLRRLLEERVPIATGPCWNGRCKATPRRKFRARRGSAPPASACGCCEPASPCVRS